MIKIGDIVTHHTSQQAGVGIVVEVLNQGYARKNASALVYWSGTQDTTYHAEPALIVMGDDND